MKKLLITMLFLLLLPLSASAEREKYIDKKFDFSKVKTILCPAPNIPAEVSDIKKRELKNLYLDTVKSEFSKLKIKWLTPNDLVDKIRVEQNIDYIELKKLDPEKAKALWLETIQKHADLVLMIKIFEYDTGTTTATRPTVSTSTAYTPHGNVTVNTYGTESYNTSALYTGVRFDAVSTRDLETPVLSVIDSRGRLASGSKQLNMYKRILDAFFEELVDLLGKD